MLRAACAAALIGYALALALSALHVVAATPGHLAAAYWPIILVVAGFGGLFRGLGRAMYGRWLPLGCLVVGATLLAAHLAGVPLPALALAAFLAWAGLAVAFGRRKDDGTAPK